MFGSGKTAIANFLAVVVDGFGDGGVELGILLDELGQHRAITQHIVIDQNLTITISASSDAYCGN